MSCTSDDSRRGPRADARAIPSRRDRPTIVATTGNSACSTVRTARRISSPTRTSTTFFAADWEVHYNSSRTGVRLIGPKPQWARSDGGEAGLHPSNIHDNAYAIGSGRFHRRHAGDPRARRAVARRLRLPGHDREGRTLEDRAAAAQRRACASSCLTPDEAAAGRQRCRSSRSRHWTPAAPLPPAPHRPSAPAAPILASHAARDGRGRRWSTGARATRTCWSNTARWCSIFELRLRVHVLMAGCKRTAYRRHHRSDAGHPLAAGAFRQPRAAARTPARAARDRPRNRCRRSTTWRSRRGSSICRCPGTTRRPGSRSPSTCNRCARTRPGARATSNSSAASTGSTAIEDVKRIVFDASYLVLGLGDVYLGAPVATPLDPRHRLVTTKYNPARTWTPENAVGIGGAYLCVYGMEGPGGYQFVGPHLPDVEHLSRDHGIRAGAALAAALLRPDPLLPGQRRGAA